MTRAPARSDEIDLETLDLSDSELFRHGFAHDIFTVLRREAPVWWQAVSEDFDGGGDEGFWVLSKYADIQAANRDSELFSSIDGPQLSYNPEIRGLMMVSMDGEQHTQHRKLISSAFTPRMVARLEDQAREWAVSIVEDALERGTCNFVEHVAYQLPMHMIADIMGIPVEDRAWLFKLAADFIQASDRESDISLERRGAIQIEMFQYAQKLGQEKRSNPQDDIWTVLSQAVTDNDRGERVELSQSELDLFFLLLTSAGSETTRNAISLGLVALLDHPDQLETMRTDSSAMRPAVEEIIRWSSPVSYFARRATRDTEIRGVKVAKGERISIWYPSGNRDDEVFEDPFRFDIARAPKPHLAFGGGGRHFCLGANLARREIAILFDELLARTREIEIVGAPRYSVQGIYNPILVSIKELPVRIA